MNPPVGAWVVGNGWDALDGQVPDPLPRLSVVVTHYAQPRELERMLRALARQDYPASLVQVIVTDDGSPEPPAVPPGVELVRQDDRGFRAAAARNRGAERATGDVLCFLDADTAPEPGYLRAISRLPALAPEAVTVGRRRHADLREVAADAPVEDAGPEHLLPEPAWLADAYARSRNLLDADDRSYRYLIAATFACTRWFWHAVGGMDESFDRYGGEDWEWAHRAWQHGGVLAHVPEAVTWHDGPEWAGRMTDAAVRRERGNEQTLLLTTRIPVDGSRGRGVATAHPDVVVRLHGRHPAAASYVCADAMLAAFPRARIELEHGADAEPYRHDPRVGPLGEGRPDARVVVDLFRPIALLDAAGEELAARLRALGTAEEGAITLRAAGETVGEAESRRSFVRRERWGSRASLPLGTLDLAGAVVVGDAPNVEAWVGGWGGRSALE